MPKSKQARPAKGAEEESRTTRQRLTYAKSSKNSKRVPQAKESEIFSTDRTDETIPRTPQDDVQKPQTPSSALRLRTPSSAQKNLISSQNSVPASETDSPTSMVAGTPSSKASKHPTARGEGAFAKQRSALSRGKRTASLIANPSPTEESSLKRPRTEASKKSATSAKATPVGKKGNNSNSTARALSWSAQKKRVQLFKPVSPVSFYGARDEKDLSDQLAYLVETDGVLIPMELHKARSEQEQKVKQEIKRIEDGRKRLLSLKRSKASSSPIPPPPAPFPSLHHLPPPQHSFAIPKNPPISPPANAQFRAHHHHHHRIDYVTEHTTTTTTTT